MKTLDRVIFMESLEIAQTRAINAQLAEKFIDALIRKGFRFSHQAPAWRIGTVPNNRTRVQVEFLNNNVHFIHLGDYEGHNSFPLKPDASFRLDTEHDIPSVADEFESIFHR